MSTLLALWLLGAATATPAAPARTPAPTPEAPIMLLQRSAGREAADRGGSLAGVAKGIKLRRPEGERVVLTNESVKSLAEGVELTTARPVGRPAAAAGPAARQGEGGKALWQARYQEARGKIAYWESEVTRLQGEVARLERDFYARDDPVYRDGVLKPAWDKALVSLREAQKSLEEAKAGPDRVLDDARRAGALPGWFRGLPEPTAAPPAGPRGPRRPRPTPLPGAGE